jgi:signal transduction histidine kinase
MRKMKVEVRSIGQTLRVSLEKVSFTREIEFVQDLINAVEEDEKILGIIVFNRSEGLLLKSPSLEGELEPYMNLIQKAMEKDVPQEMFKIYRNIPVFSYSFPLKDRKGRTMGGVSILQNASFVERDIKEAERDIFITIFILLCGTIIFILLGMKQWISRPISQLVEATKELARGNLNVRIEWKRSDELSELGQAFNQMATELREAQKKIIEEAHMRLELERTLRHSEKLATVGQLASGLAHEIGTPLNIITGRIELTRRKINDLEVQKNLEIIAEQTDRITKIIRQLLGYVRKKKISQRRINVNDLLDRTLSFLDYQILRQNVELVKDYPKNLPQIYGDRDQLQQVFLNLFLNALQAMPKGGTLRLSVSLKQISKEGNEENKRFYIEIDVEDSGVGMKREVLENIFNPFFTTKDSGSGLGLMVTKGIVQDHEGWIEVESEVGKGSRFKVYFPVYEGE